MLLLLHICSNYDLPCFHRSRDFSGLRSFQRKTVTWAQFKPVCVYICLHTRIYICLYILHRRLQTPVFNACSHRFERKFRTKTLYLCTISIFYFWVIFPIRYDKCLARYLVIHQPQRLLSAVRRSAAAGVVLHTDACPDDCRPLPQTLSLG